MTARGSTLTLSPRKRTCYVRRITERRREQHSEVRGLRTGQLVPASVDRKLTLTSKKFRGSKKYRPFYPWDRILNVVNHRRADRHLHLYPQVAIFAFDNIGLVINQDGRYEADSLEILGDFLTHEIRIDRHTTALDIGANVGNHAIFFSSFFDRVIAFEPNPKVFEILRVNSANSNITAINCGLSDKAACLSFSINPKNLGGSRVVASDSESTTSHALSISIDVVRLDDVSQIMEQRVSLVKIDVEGHELQVLEGAVGLIGFARPVIVFEQGPTEIHHGTSPVIDFLRAHDYELFTIRNNFHLGQAFISRIASVFLRIVFGFRKEIVPTTYFEKQFYEMIIGVPR